MEHEEYSKMYEFEDSYWWFQGRKYMMGQIVSSLPNYATEDARILDLGCGTGLMLEHFSKTHWSAGLDFSNLALQFSQKKGANKLLQANVEDIPIADNSLDIITALDLAEHVANDDQMFAETYRTLKPGGRMVLTVPAHPFLWSDHDDALHHHRRYTRKELKKRLTEAGFEIERLSWSITFTFPIIVAFRLFQRCFQHSSRPKTHLILLPRWANSLLTMSVRLEALLLKYINLPFGVTLMAVAHKEAKSTEEKST